MGKTLSTDVAPPPTSWYKLEDRQKLKMLQLSDLVDWSLHQESSSNGSQNFAWAPLKNWETTECYLCSLLSLISFMSFELLFADSLVIEFRVITPLFPPEPYFVICPNSALSDTLKMRFLKTSKLICQLSLSQSFSLFKMMLL